MRLRRSLITLTCVMLTGCASVNPGPDFNDVAQATQSRTGHKIVWAQDSREDQQVANAVDALLKRTLTVNDAVQIALLNNQGLQATYEDIGISQADLVQAGLLKNPSFSAMLRFPDQPPSLADLELSVVQDFLDLFTLPLRKKVAAAELEQTKLEVGGKVVDLAAEVKEAFYTLQAEEQLLKRLKVILDVNQSGAELAGEQHKAGTLSELDEQNLQVVYNENKAAVSQAQVEIDASREKLNRLMGLWGAQLDWTVSDQLPEVPETLTSLENLESLAIHQRLDLAAARSEVEKLRQAVALAGGTRFLPGGVNIGADTEKNSDGQRVTGPSLNLQIPVFDQGQAQLARTVGAERKAEAQYRNLSIIARSEVREARDRIVAAHDLVQLYQKVLLPQRVKILQLAQEHYNYMLKGAYDLLQAKEHELDTERAYVESSRAYWVAHAQLERAVGGTLRVIAPDEATK
jgi:cobalt-zinc-cadmium efflux system outer membrane protein